MAEKGGTKILIIVTIIIILFSIGFSGCISNSDNDSKYTSYKSYKLSIETNETNNYEIYVPIAYINPSTPSKLFDKLSNDSIEQIETKYGTALKIRYQGNFSFSIELTEFESDTLLLSMREIKEVNKPTLFVWIYYNGTDTITLSIELYSEIEEDFIYQTEKEWCDDKVIQENGWFQLEFETETTVD